MSTVLDTPKLAWRHTSGRFWGWVMRHNDNFFVGQIPNALTILRLAAPVTGYLSYRCFVTDQLSLAWVWLAVTALLVATDYLDGKAARSLQRISNFGKVLDPFSDKLITAAMLIYFLRIVMRHGFVNRTLMAGAAIMVATLLMFEAILLTISVMALVTRRWRLGSNDWGKLKFRWEVAAIALTFVLLYLARTVMSHEIATILLIVGLVPATYYATLSLRGHLAAKNAT